MKRGCKEIQITEEKTETKIIGSSKEKLINNFKKSGYVISKKLPRKVEVDKMKLEEEIERSNHKVLLPITGLFVGVGTRNKELSVQNGGL